MNNIYWFIENTYCHPPSYWLRLFSSQTFSRINTPTFSTPVILHTYPATKMGQSVLKHRHIKFRRRGIAQKKAYNRLYHVRHFKTFMWRTRQFCLVSLLCQTLAFFIQAEIHERQATQQH